VPFNVGPGGYGGADLWVTTRETTGDEWGPRMNLGSTINSPAADTAPCISADGLSLYFSSDRPGGYGNYDLWMSTRSTTKDAWTAPVNFGPSVNSPADESFVSISGDGLHIYLAEWQRARPGGCGSADLWLTTRPTISDPWGEPVNLGPTVNSSAYDADHSISADGLSLYFTSTRSGGLGNEDIWMTRRATAFDPWAAPVNLGPSINSSAHDAFPNFSADGYTLYFSSSRPGGFGGYDLWQVSTNPVVDFNGDGSVDGKEVLVLVDHWGQNEPSCDIGPTPMGDGVVNLQDLMVLAEHVGKEVCDPTLASHWAFDETEGDAAHDSIGDNHATVLGGAVWQPTEGMVDGALFMDGIDDFVATGGVPHPDGPMTVLAWVKGGRPGQVILSQFLGTDWLMADPSGGHLLTDLKASGRSARALVSETAITDGNWHRVGLVWDGTNRMLYVDDEVVAADTQPNLVGSNGGLNIGCDKNQTPGSFWSGLIDEVRIYSRVVKP